MELIGNHLQIFVSAIVILGAAAVALICDLLKSNNEHLREMNVELRIRREEEQRRSQLILQTTATLNGAPAALPSPAAAPAIASGESRLAAAQAQPAIDRAAELVSRRGVREQAAPVVAEAAPDFHPGASLAEARMLAREFMGRAATRAGADQLRTDQPETSQTQSVAVPAARQPEVMAASARVAPGLQRKNWDALLSSTRKNTSAPATVEMVVQPEAAAPRQRMAQLIPFETIQNQSDELAIPEGFHEGMMIARILNGQKAVRGLVVVIGINDFASRRETAGELGTEALVASFTDHLRTILGPGDFACQSSQDEFLMICPNERGAPSQRRLGEIAESLWDFQFRTVGTSVILFSWGGVEAKGEPFADILAAAADRMRETRRSRRSLSLDAPLHRKAV